MNISLHFESRLQASPEQLWRWITSVDGILREIRPLLSMSVPPGIRSLEDLEVVPRRPLFRSHMRLFGLLPLGTSQLTLLELTPGRGFIEQSPMTGMRLWRHERRILPTPGEAGECLLIDQLTVRPLFAAGLVRWFLTRIFRHRHRVLCRQFRADRR